MSLVHIHKPEPNRLVSDKNEGHLNELLDFIRSKDEYANYDIGISTCPLGDAIQASVFYACLELEKRSLIYRIFDKPERVVWMPTD